jgi:hypothetical protein
MSFINGLQVSEVPWIMTFKSGIIALVILLCAIGIATGIKYSRYIESDPGYCAICHLTEEGYSSWERSPHYLIACQSCHKMTVIEGNKLLLTYYLKGSESVTQEHGRIAPWKTCIECHNREAAQGSITFKNSFGHARHVFMKSISCDNCHKGELHDLKVNSVNCRQCHADKLVHGMGTSGMNCLNCHRFTDRSESLVSSERCLKCHTNIPEQGIMSQLKCHECHKPHSRLKSSSKDCLGECHSNEARVGQHELHFNITDLKCQDCHEPHLWEVGAEKAKGLCDRCHALKDPVSFIYLPPKTISKP